ncbi:efflux RND transporter periplasmic adaptor subunit [Phenylobacterium montanum]|uniref:Efflux RND transporter periplasmic adaptor subunit n=2 Tax=Phenylobacterium montanum TaxID=2823693 RepID=A0A975IXH4_9CAUL|nr:efflux RND transporter periplasmic adaptor subunit [Caulobacter sp. S6]
MVRRAAAAVGLSAALALAACSPGEQNTPPSAPAVIAERLTLREQPIADLKPVAAVITSRDMAEARARIGGTLVRLLVKEGDAVRRGQLIGQVADEKIGFQTRAYDAQVGAAEAENERAQAELTRSKDLFDHGVYAKARYDQAVAGARAAAGALNAAKAQRSASAELGAQGAVLAPADGRVLHAATPAGSVVAPGQSIATLTVGQTVVRAEIPEGQAVALKTGEQVAVEPDQAAGVTSAVVSQIYPAVSAGRVTVDLTAPGLEAGLVGQRVRVRLPAGQRPALVAPRRFIVTRFGVDYAAVLQPGGQVADVPVQLAPGPAADQVEILSGLAAGDTIVRAGAGK